jgi:hypothetical protein
LDVILYVVDDIALMGVPLMIPVLCENFKPSGSFGDILHHLESNELETTELNGTEPIDSHGMELDELNEMESNELDHTHGAELNDSIGTEPHV